MNYTFKDAALELDTICREHGLSLELTQTQRKRLLFTIKTAANSGKPLTLAMREAIQTKNISRETVNLTQHKDPTFHAAMRLLNATPKTRKRILFELGEGRA